MQKLKVGVVGIGGMGITHIGAYMLDDRVQVIATCATQKSKLEKINNGEWPKVTYYEGEFQPIYRIQKAYTNFEDLVKDPDIDVVSVCTPNNLHFPITKAALENGKHVLVEKPMTLTHEEAHALVDLAERKNKLLAVGHMWRFHSHIQYAKEIIKAGILGDIVKIKGYAIHEDWIPEGSGTWFTNPELAGGGALIDMGIHPIDTIVFLLEGAEVAKVYANTRTAYGNYKVEDVGVVHLEFSNGTFAMVEFGWGNPHKDGDECSIQIFGTKGYMRIFPTSIKCEVKGVRGVFKPQLEEGHLTKELYVREIKHFIDSILEGTTCIISGKQALKTMRVIDAAYLSSKEGRIIDLQGKEGWR